MNTDLKDNKRLFFSIIIPTRNRPQIMLEALGSALNQDHESFEVIIVNDGSDELYMSDYMHAARLYANKVSLLNLEQSMKGHGPGYAVNQGVNAAKGEYIAFLDDDDIWISNNHLSVAKNILDNTDADIYLTLQQAYKNNQLVDRENWLSPLASSLNSNKEPMEVDVNFLMKCDHFAHRNNLIIKKSLYLSINGHDENLDYEEDREFYLRVIDRSDKNIFNPVFISRHNIPVNEASFSTTISDHSKFVARINLFDKILVNSVNQCVVDYAGLHKSYTLKAISESLYKGEQYRLAAHYAKQALLIKFNPKWMLFTFFLMIKNIL